MHIMHVYDNRIPGNIGKLVSLNCQGSFYFTVHQYLDAIFYILYNTFFKKGIPINHITLIKSRQSFYIDNIVYFLKFIGETSFGEPSVKRSLTTLVAELGTTACPRLLALVPLTGCLA